MAMAKKQKQRGKDRGLKKRELESDGESECKAVLCEDPKTGKLRLRFGKCNAGERRRLVGKVASEGLFVVGGDDD